MATNGISLAAQNEIASTVQRTAVTKKYYYYISFKAAPVMIINVLINVWTVTLVLHKMSSSHYDSTVGAHSVVVRLVAN